MDETGWNDVRAALDDLDYPASKDQVVAHVERRGGSGAALRLLRGLPLATYLNLDEIRRSVPIDPAADDGQTVDQKARQARSPHDHRIAEHLRDLGT
ncbi:DUF2795 domain-containing protein [Phytohabitans suffuscus]|uniref:DUF2795 domain-containing protein n=1 Tax=Phytohabitans suffuscus TaxID=624315 RepID=A0A6F8YVT4_9ACTN|nr:DUF2795 domain-containing protein [Phytohabitans suffuscus]BCB90189.1 hypothetical protein Psuf_075020 [Phytohabitans suffuscus]